MNKTFQFSTKSQRLIHWLDKTFPNKYWETIVDLEKQTITFKFRKEAVETLPCPVCNGTAFEWLDHECQTCKGSGIVQP